MKLSDLIAGGLFHHARAFACALGDARDHLTTCARSPPIKYASPVAYAYHVLRLTPIDRSGQRVQAAALDIEPAPIGRQDGRDFFGNHMTWIALDEPHDRLVGARSRRASRSKQPTSRMLSATPALGGRARRGRS